MIEVKQGQSFLDIVLQSTGNIENALQCAILNGGSITEELSAGRLIEPLLAPAKPNNEVIKFFSPADQKPATAIRRTFGEYQLNEGISYWGINNDFIVS